MNHSEDPVLHNFDLFCQALTNALGDPELKKTMLRRIKGLRQTSSASSYRTKFENYAQYLSIGDEALKEYLYDGLKESVKDAMADLPAELEPTDFDEFKSWCVRIDIRLHDHKNDHPRDTQRPRPVNKGHTSSGTHRFAPQIKISGPTRVMASDSMDIDSTSSARFKPLDDKERKRRYDNNLCLYCGQPGHRATACPAKQTTKRPFGRLRATLSGPAMTVKTTPTKRSGNDQP